MMNWWDISHQVRHPLSRKCRLTSTWSSVFLVWCAHASRCSAEDAILSEMGRPPELVGSACPMVTSDIVALNLEVNTSALNINDHTPTPDHARPKDFLDLMDSTLPPPTNGTSREWETTPTRPHMFPHKLYWSLWQPINPSPPSWSIPDLSSHWQ